MTLGHWPEAAATGKLPQNIGLATHLVGRDRCVSENRT